MTPEEFRARKAELERRDGTVVPPEILALVKRGRRVDKMRAATIKRLQKRSKKDG